METVFEVVSDGRCTNQPEGIVPPRDHPLVGNATLEIDERTRDNQPMPATCMCNVPDTDAVYALAIESGSTSFDAPRNAPLRRPRGWL